MCRRKCSSSSPQPTRHPTKRPEQWAFRATMRLLALSVSPCSSLHSHTAAPLSGPKTVLLSPLSPLSPFVPAHRPRSRPASCPACRYFLISSSCRSTRAWVAQTRAKDQNAARRRREEKFKASWSSRGRGKSVQEQRRGSLRSSAEEPKGEVLTRDWVVHEFNARDRLFLASG
jgi:hypothetical protein